MKYLKVYIQRNKKVERKLRQRMKLSPGGDQLGKRVTVNWLIVGEKRCANNDLVGGNVIEGTALN